MSGPREDLGRPPAHIRVSSIAGVEFVDEDVEELRDVLRRAGMNNVEIVRRDGRTLRYRGEQPDDDELNVARR